ncbi:MAG: hydroxymethylglutaryl-CoA synthase family protein [Dehalococcoidales bacterium]|nr:hydroxymethylglutaryl-CoA synthase family protein [Dehalococcoidales bacterium]
MAGIISYGAYIPFYRISRAEIARAWGSAPSPGERAVANYDEDSLTMAFAAALDCIKGLDRGSIGGLYFASTTAPYKEKQTAATIATVLGLPAEAVTMDFSGSLRCGTNALKAAMDAVYSGSARNILVCVSDNRLGYPAGPNEMAFGDGAAALLVGNENTIADIDLVYSKFYEIQDVWRSDRDTFVRNAEERFSTEEGYSRTMNSSISAALAKSGLAAGDFARIALYSPNTRQLRSVVQKLGFNEKTQVQDVMHNSVGDTGSAMSLMSLIAALEQAGQDENLLLAGYGNGADVFILKTNSLINGLKDRRGIRKYLASKAVLTNYSRYMRWRELIQVQPPARPPIEIRQPTPAAQWREAQWELRLTGTRCKHCGAPQYPPQRICMVCHTKDQMEPYTFFEKPARVFSFSHDYVMQTMDPPVTITFVDFEGGGRLMCDMTDRDPESVQVGMPLEMTFRKLYYVGGIYNYWWKCQPARA